jgi:hypothetical protein
MLYIQKDLAKNILVVPLIWKQDSGCSMICNQTPSYCCPTLVTEAMKSRIEEVIGVPVVTIEYRD